MKSQIGSLSATKGLPSGAFLLSIDTELAWGGVHSGAFRARRELYDRTRPAISRLLELLAQYEIHATWAVVGHLFLEGCSSLDGIKHPDIVRPNYDWFHGDWFKDDPCTAALSAPHWYGPDIVREILECSARQEIGCHTFSHVIAGDPGCSRECFDSELKASRAAAESWGIRLESFVFPRNSVGHVDVLAENGFLAFRGVVGANWDSRLPRPLSKIVKGLQWTSPLPPLTVAPIESHGMWNLPATSFYLHRGSIARLVPVALRVQRALAGISRAARTKTTFHMYFHPFNLATDESGLLGGLATIFRRVAEARDRGLLMNPTMGDLARSLRSVDGSVAAAS